MSKTKTEHLFEKAMKRITGYVAGKAAYCAKINIDCDELALAEILMDSELYLDWIAGKAERPIIFRHNRNLGYIRGNIFVGTKADKHRTAIEHAKQRSEARATGAYYKPKPLTRSSIGAYVTKEEWEAGIRPTKQKADPASDYVSIWISDKKIRVKKPEAIEHDRKKKQAARKQRWRQKRGSKPRP